MATSFASQRSGPRLVPRTDRAEPSGAHLALLIHAGMASSVIVALGIINALVDQSTWWVLWVAWAWGMVLALQAGATYRVQGWLGAHSLVSGIFCVGIVGTNLALGGGAWSPWVLAAVSAPLIGHWLVARRGVPILAAQTVASGILFAEVVLAQILYPSDRWSTGLSIASSMLTLSVLLICTVFLTGRRSS